MEKQIYKHFWELLDRGCNVEIEKDSDGINLKVTTKGGAQFMTSADSLDNASKYAFDLIFRK